MCTKVSADCSMREKQSGVTWSSWLHFHIKHKFDVFKHTKVAIPALYHDINLAMVFLTKSTDSSHH